MKKQQVDKVIADIWTSFAQETFPLGPHNEQQFFSMTFSSDLTIYPLLRDLQCTYQSRVYILSPSMQEAREVRLLDYYLPQTY
jgi:hypothetical protein